MALKHNVSAVWKDIVIWTNVAGTWKKCAMHHNVSAVWKSITSLLGASLPASLYIWAVRPTNASITLNSSGAYSTTGSGGGSGTWMNGGTGADYEARATLVSGTLTSGTTGTWLALSTSRTWQRNSPVSGVLTAQITLEIRLAASPFTVLTSSSVTLEGDSGL
jgi:hypothetical protein